MDYWLKTFWLPSWFIGYFRCHYVNENNLGIPLLDAFAIAWRGLGDSDAYKNSTDFDVGGQSYSKAEISALGTQYYINQTGTSICP